jgi:hypothetical protein
MFQALLAAHFLWPDNTNSPTIFGDMPFCHPPAVIPISSCSIMWLLCCALFGGSTTADTGERDKATDLAAEAEVEVPMFTLVLPTWTTDPQKVQLVKPDEDDLSQFELESHQESHSASAGQSSPDSHPENVAVSMPEAEHQVAPNQAGFCQESASLTDSASTPDSDSITSVHLLIPQLAPPTPEAIEFPKWTPASDIWIKGFADVVEGERHKQAGDLVAAISSFQSARGTYEVVKSRFPEWQSEIVSFRLADLERRIRQLVKKTATSSSKAR